MKFHPIYWIAKIRENFRADRYRGETDKDREEAEKRLASIDRRLQALQMMIDAEARRYTDVD